MFRGGRQVSQVGQAPSGPTVIRPLFGMRFGVQEPKSQSRSGTEWVVAVVVPKL